MAEQLGIRFYVANYTREFREEVMLPFADAYLAGRTPLPCATCNTRFKFDRLLARARALGADGWPPGTTRASAATRRRGSRRCCGRARRGEGPVLLPVRPRAGAARRARFPLGELTKPEVRARARALGLATAEKPESQELCFVPDGDTGAAVERLRPGRAPGPGEIVDEAGRVLGRHAGIHHYTVGQRRGLGVSAAEPLYVTALDAARNRVRVTAGRGLERAPAASAQRVLDLGRGAARALRAPGAHPPSARGRARARHADADGGAELAFDEPVRALAPGQAAVFYVGEQVLGGGWIAGAAA